MPITYQYASKDDDISVVLRVYPDHYSIKRICNKTISSEPLANEAAQNEKIAILVYQTVLEMVHRQSEPTEFRVQPTYFSAIQTFNKMPQRGTFSKEIHDGIEQIISGNFTPKTNCFKLKSPERSAETPFDIPELSLSKTKAGSLSFFQSSQKFLSDHKNVLIAGILSAGLGGGIGLTLTNYDQMVSASLISNSLLLGLLIGLIALICFMINQFQQQHAATPSRPATNPH